MFDKDKTILTTGPYMRRFFFLVSDAVALVDTALKNIKFLIMVENTPKLSCKLR
jgi:FlaA1/EpsC-like NDP-sugar epimerase